MPGLNQLKQFVSDIKNVGDEVKIRTQRGEKPAVVPLPEGISEADDSEDFVLGLPEPAAEEIAADSEETDAESINPDDIVSQDADDSSAAIPDLDALLNPVGQESDSVPDLSDFLDTPKETPLEDLDLDALLKSSEPAETEEPEPLDTPGSSSGSDLPDFGSLGDLPDFGDFDSSLDSLSENNSPSDIPDINADFGSDNSGGDSIPAMETPAKETSDSISDDGFGDGLGDSDDFAFDGNAIDLNEDIPEEIAEEDGSMPVVEETPETETVPEVTSDAMDSDTSAPASFDFETPDFEAPAASPDSVENMFSTDGLDFPSSDNNSLDFPSSDNNGLDLPAGDGAMDFNIPDMDFSGTDMAGEREAEESSKTAAQAILDNNDGFIDASMDVPPEDFSDSMEGMGDADSIDFGDTSSPAGEEFPVTDPYGAGDDFLLDENSFEIPGFSDTETASFGKKGKVKVDVADFSQAKTGRPKNTLTDEEYVVFKKNLSAYPLNLRLAIEEMLVKNGFTDDAEFDVVETILKKVPARQLATHLEKLLDISIDVPRDYERRSVAQYEAYKQSFQYQLKNRIIPGGIAAALIAIVCYALFQASVSFIYNPAMATLLYKQGYTLLENNEYPQSEQRFSEAVKYKPIKKWFFKYARGYRSHKQYERAGQMYKKTLVHFKNDKAAGIEWAEMELYERSNYERAENIARREVLDHHINDADGILLLGDVFLEWGEENAEKYEDAREQYATLINLYGVNDLYLSRMMRYFIRTDKLRNVLELKARFYPRKKSLCAQDWGELSGYMLDKLYGKLSRSEESLRSSIEDVRAMLDIAIKADPSIPVPHYNMARYFIHNNNFEAAKSELNKALDCFDRQEFRTRKNTYKEIDSCRILGELYADTREYLKAQEVYTRGIDLYQTENERDAGFTGDYNTGLLYADMGDIEYFISGDMDAALKNYEMALKNKNDTASINYRVGAVYYSKNVYDKALDSFIRAKEKNDTDINLKLALGNVLSLRGDNFAAQGYYTELLNLLDKEKERHYILYPQEKEDDNGLVEMFLKVNNNLGVTLYRLARQTGDSNKNAQATVRLSDSIRAWDALTRNPETMVRLGGSNLALQNSKYIMASRADFEPAIYTDIPKTMVAEKILN